MSDAKRDPYQVLGIGPHATSADISRAYRRLARVVHPDSRPGDPAAAGQFAALTDAYGLLSDPVRRAAWDHQHPPQAAPRHASPRAPATAGPVRWPFPPDVPSWPDVSPAPGAALRAGPVYIQPPLPDSTGQPARPADDPALAGLLWWLPGPWREWPW